MKEKIKKFIENYISEDHRSFSFDDCENIDSLFSGLEEEELIDFGVYLRGNASGSDWWLQVEYWSEKLSKCVIFDYDFKVFSESTPETLAEDIIKLQEDINNFESKLIKINS